MGRRSTQVILRSFLLNLFYCLHVLVVADYTNPNDSAALTALKANWQQIPPNWKGDNPCGDGWEGIECTNSSITSMVLSGMGLRGNLSEDIGKLQELQILDLSENKELTGKLPTSIGNLKSLSSLYLVGCSFYGKIPDTIGSLTQLISLSLASNNFSGSIPRSIGNLTNLLLLDVTNNSLSGAIPVSDGNSPGLDLLVKAEHFHCGQNKLNGSIPPKLFSSKMKLIHVLFDNNELSGNIPSTLELVTSLEVLRLDGNSLNGTIELNFTGHGDLSELYLSNNRFTGLMPNLSNPRLTYVDMSNNSFDLSPIPSWFSSMDSLTSLIMAGTQLQGPIPSALFSLRQLQSVILSNNELSGLLNISTTFSKNLVLIDLQHNSIDSIIEFAPGIGYDKPLMLQGNPFCGNGTSSVKYCSDTQQPNSSYFTPENCVSISCSSGQLLSPNCKCAYPITGTLYFKSYSFSDFQNPYYYSELNVSMMKAFQSNKLPVESIFLSTPYKDMYNYLNMRLEVFPSGNIRFNRTGFAMVTSQLNNIAFFQVPREFGPIGFSLDNNAYFQGQRHSSSTKVIIGAVVGSCVLVSLLVLASVYAFHQKNIAKRANQRADPFALWNKNEENTGGPPQIKGVRGFSFQELKNCTNNFSSSNLIGTGGYGKVYRGILDSGVLIAIKRAKQGSMQGSAEFKTEIELLSRLHHKNLVCLLGFCYEQGEQMLVYEYASNGTLKDTILGKSGIQLNWTKRLKLALDSARGLAYLHEFADPPIIHRDVKSNNILLDTYLIAKVADFGLSITFQDSEGPITSSVKGTMGYLDPEYFNTNQLTDKSDVYSFGVVMLELITARNPIEHGSYIVREFKTAMDKKKEFYDLHKIIDPTIDLKTTVGGFEKYVDLAIRCVEELGDNRPTMSKVVKELENILQDEIPNKHIEMVSTSASFNVTGELFNYSGSFPYQDIKLQ